MPDDPRESDWHKATAGACPHCGNLRDIERRGDEWWCPSCLRQFPALSENDTKFLHQIKIEPK